MSIPREQRMRALLLALLLIKRPAMACEWKWEITYWSDWKTWQEEIVASSREDAEEAAKHEQKTLKVQPNASINNHPGWLPATRERQANRKKNIRKSQYVVE